VAVPPPAPVAVPLPPPPAAALAAAGQEADDVVDAPGAAPAPDPTMLGPRLADSRPILLSRLDRGPRRAVERLLEPNGEIVLHEIDSASGLVHSCEPVGTLHRMRVLEQRPGPAGSVTQVVRDESGALLRYSVGSDGEPRGVVVFAPAPPPLGIFGGSRER
jgi:hypothetical protein